MASQEYSNQDIDDEPRKLVNRKENGGDGMPGESYEATRKWGAVPITKITNAIKNGQGVPRNWANGTIVYMCKNKGGNMSSETNR